MKIRYPALLALTNFVMLYGATYASDDLVNIVNVEAAHYDQRHQETASIIVVNHDDLLRFGDTSLADALKRIPGISIGGAGSGLNGERAGEIRLHGLGGGYTQIMLNGVVAPNGFTLESLSPELIERVEIMPTASAELGAQGIAGTINIILRKSVAHPRREFKLELGEQDGARSSQLMPTLSGEVAGTLNNVDYVVVGTLSRTRLTTSTEIDTSAADGYPAAIDTLHRLTQEQKDSRTDNLNLTPRFTFHLSDDDSLTSQSYINAKHATVAQTDQDTTLLGTTSQYPASDRQFDLESTVLRSDLNWTHTFDEDTRFTLKAGASDSFRHSDFRFFGTDGSADGSGLHLVQAGINEYGITLAGNLNFSLTPTHAITLGWDGAQTRRSESRMEQDYVPATLQNPPAATQNDRYDGTITRGALFVQDDWDISAAWSLSAGLRWEKMRTAVISNALLSAPESSNEFSSIVSPLIQTLYKFSPDDQLRIGLTRTYKEPTMVELIPRLYTVDNNNSPTNPDTQGNPALRPELAWGLDAGVEHEIGKNGLIGASMFVRRIDDVIAEQLFQEGINWVLQPVNAGRANVHGITLEAKFTLNSLLEVAPPVELRANLTRNWSNVESLPGPNNRLDQQTPLSANLGLDYHLPGNEFTLGTNFNLTSGGPAQTTAQLASYSAPVRSLDAFALWAIDSQSRIRFSADNLLHQNQINAFNYADNGSSERTISTMRTATTLRLTWEVKFGM
ncbi:TonB-dependent receptor plug domain-containing protein [Solimicrobium silvestre]|uniref:TonB-dependent Receptor Plug Domain n=1 Tax=Solimicrobium silvestre TaxID=2099400 RepID=A0A2S9H0V8_9BURK|nr:TonB-dependent receptor [Solimicrobium silvestre]PRC93598.1 TonB-dependent Receptor Plug Domain [Solimicrobium silvestre]